MPILPVDLVRSEGLTAAEYAEFGRKQRQRLREHGVHPSDWRQVHAVLKASKRAHGIPDVTARGGLWRPLRRRGMGCSHDPPRDADDPP